MGLKCAITEHMLSFRAFEIVKLAFNAGSSTPVQTCLLIFGRKASGVNETARACHYFMAALFETLRIGYYFGGVLKCSGSLVLKAARIS